MATGGGGIGGGEGAASCYQRKGWMRDDLVKRLKHIETPSKQGATELLCFFLGDEVVIHFGKILYRKV